MNAINFIDNGFILIYPDRKEKWVKVKDINIVNGLNFIKYKGCLYIEKN